MLNELNNNNNDFAVRVATRGGKMTQEPLYPEGHPKRIEQDSQRNNIDAPTPSKKKKKKLSLIKERYQKLKFPPCLLIILLRVEYQRN